MNVDVQQQQQSEELRMGGSAMSSGELAGDAARRDARQRHSGFFKAGSANAFIVWVAGFVVSVKLRGESEERQ